MHRLSIPSFSATLLLTGLLYACSLKQTQNPTLETLRNDVAFLAQDSLKGRLTGSPEELRAGEYIIDRLRKSGVIPYGSSGYHQPFPYPSGLIKKSPQAGDEANKSPESNGQNIVGMIENEGQNIIIIGAHYDHLGYGNANSLSPNIKAIHNGADDNASGVALMLWLAHELQQHAVKSDLIFIAFSGEEEGLLGSKFFCNNPTVDLSKVSAMINLDMVGRLDPKKGVIISGVGTSAVWKNLLVKANTDTLRLVFKPSGIGPSDHTSFYLKNIPSLHFFTGAHSDYHRPSDDVDKINYEGMYSIGKLILETTLSLDSLGKIPFSTTKNEMDERPRFSVVLGVMPDYAFTNKGMRIDAITAGGAAEKAAIRPGDIITQIGAIPINDLNDYMRALARFKKGDQTTVTVQRKQTLHTLKVTF